MDTRRSYCLSSRPDDFAELDAETRRPNTTDIHYVIPANDNSPTKRLTRALMRFNDCMTCGRQSLLPIFVTDAGKPADRHAFEAGNLAGDRLAFYATTLPALA